MAKYAARKTISNLGPPLVSDDAIFRVLVENVTDYAIFFLDKEGIISSWNEGARRSKGYLANEVVGKHFSILYPVDDVGGGKCERELKEAVETGRYEEEGWRVRKDGSKFWAHVIINRINDANDELIGFSKITRDLTERKKAQDELQSSRERFEVIANGTHHGIFEVDFKTRGVYLSPTCKALLGIPQSTEVNLDTWGDQIHPADKDRVSSTRKAYIEKKTPSHEVEYRYIHKGSKEVRWLNSRGQATWDKNGEPIKFCGFLRDITELKRATSLVNSYQAALDGSAIVAFTDSKGIITYVNDYFCQLSGYSREELLGQDHRTLNSSQHSKEFFADLWKTISSGNIWRGEVCHRKKTGEPYWVDAVIVPQINENGEIEQYISIRFDVTQRRAVEAKLNHTAKMSALGEMAGGIAHEINNPLGIIRTSAEQLVSFSEAGKLDHARLKRLTESISTTVERTAKIISGLRSFARDGSKDPFLDVKVQDIIDGTLDFCRTRFESTGIKIRVEPINPDLSMRCRQVQISQIILNLLNNAFDAVEGTPNAFVEIGVEKASGGYLEISVKDSGKGILPEIAEKIMQPFFTTKDVGKGTGLGLSVSVGLAQAHNGELTLDQSCKNTRFVLRLPMLQPKGSV